MASEKFIDYHLLLKTVIGVSLIIASNCVINNIIDRNIDKLMERTKYRILAKKLITLQNAIIYAIILFITGYVILFYATNLKVIYLTIISSIVYIGIYSFLIKKKSIYSTLIGSIAGATPPIIGYCSIKNIDIGAIILSTIFIVWQIPHFYSIAIFRIQDYQMASIPVFPIRKGIESTRKHIIFYIILFMGNIAILKLNNYISFIFLFCMEILGGIWLYTTFLKNKETTNNHYHIITWAKKIFIMSIVIIIFFNIGIIIDSIYYKQITLLS